MSGDNKDNSDSRSDKSFDHGLNPQSKESFKDYSARKSTEFESSSQVQFYRRYLNNTEPAMFMIHALVLFFVSVLLAFFAGQFIGIDSMAHRGAYFIGTLSSLVRVTSAAMVAWGIGRLISDAIKEGNRK